MMSTDFLKDIFLDFLFVDIYLALDTYLILFKYLKFKQCMLNILMT